MKTIVKLLNFFYRPLQFIFDRFGVIAFRFNVLWLVVVLFVCLLVVIGVLR